MFSFALNIRNNAFALASKVVPKTKWAENVWLLKGIDTGVSSDRYTSAMLLYPHNETPSIQVVKYIKVSSN